MNKNETKFIAPRWEDYFRHYEYEGFQNKYCSLDACSRCDQYASLFLKFYIRAQKHIFFSNW